MTGGLRVRPVRNPTNLTTISDDRLVICSPRARRRRRGELDRVSKIDARFAARILPTS